jgi:hypothetical protein
VPGALESIRGTGLRPGILLRPAPVAAGKGSVSERPKEHASKACVGESPPWVQIPPLPHPEGPQPQNPADLGAFVMPGTPSSVSAGSAEVWCPS